MLKNKARANNKIFNYYSKKDQVLNILFKAATLKIDPIGRGEINLKNVENINVTNEVNSHFNFKKELINIINKTTENQSFNENLTLIQ